MLQVAVDLESGNRTTNLNPVPIWGYIIPFYVMDANGGNEEELASGCVSFFSPKGKQILYGVYCDDTDDLFLMNADGSEPFALTGGYECKNATWSPDGTRIVFQLSQTTQEGPFQLYIPRQVRMVSIMM